MFVQFWQWRTQVGCLLLRLALAAGLIADMAADFSIQPVFHGSLVLSQGLAAALLAIGLYTPLTAFATCLLHLVMAFTQGSVNAHLQAAAMGGCLALLGAGSWSLDVRLFGRRRIVIKLPGED